MIALGQHVVTIYQTERVFGPGYMTFYQYAELADGRWAFRLKSDRPGQRRATLSWTRWKAASNPPDAARLAAQYERIFPVGGSESPAAVDTNSEGSSSDTRRTRADNRPSGPAVAAGMPRARRDDGPDADHTLRG